MGLSSIGVSSPVAEEIINLDSTRLAASSVALFALFNGISRPRFGWLSDRFKPHYVAIASYTLILTACVRQPEVNFDIKPQTIICYA
jgi:nitrate/nitrite transporter NarK